MMFWGSIHFDWALNELLKPTERVHRMNSASVKHKLAKAGYYVCADIAHSLT